MEWQELRDKIYYQDGSLRDIYIQGTTEDDWKLWTELVNRSYNVSFSFSDGDITIDKIVFSKVLEFWNVKDSSVMASVYLGDIIVKAYFFTAEEIENDITPKEIISLDDHNKLINYLKEVSHTLKKRVILCPENDPKTVLIEVDQNNVALLPS